MNTTERRVSDLLRAYGERLEMTTQDIDRLEHGLEQKQTKDREARRRRVTRIAAAAVAACAVTGAVLGALALRGDHEPGTQPASPPAVSLAQLEGIWRVDGSDWLWRFTHDGKLIVSNKPDLLTATPPADADRVRPAPGGFVMVDPADPKCESRWSASISADGHMQATQPPETAACPGEDGVASAGRSWGLTRVSPVSVAGSTAKSNSEPIAPVTVTLENQDSYLTGTWLLRGTGTVLTVLPNPQDADSFIYAVQDLGSSADGPETGTMRARIGGQLSFLPRWPTDPCALDYDSVVTHGNSLDAKRAPGTCSRVGTGNDTWIRLN